MLNPPRLIGQVPVFEAVLKPSRVVAAAEMMKPRRLVDPFGDLRKHHEILRPQIVLRSGAGEIEAARAQVAHRVLALVPHPLRPTAGDCDREWRLIAPRKPGDRTPCLVHERSRPCELSAEGL